MSKWEYLVHTVRINDTCLEKILESFGENGWELVSVDSGSHYFKRPKLQEPEKELEDNT